MTLDVLIGDCRDTLKTLADRSVHCVVTSPPYFGLRDYGGKSEQIGLEPTPDEFVAAILEVFAEIKRVLRDDGTVWLNLGDSYATTKVGNTNGTQGNVKQKAGVNDDTRKRTIPKGLKHKDLIGIPWRVAFALQAEGWYLRQDIIWHKPNVMPESVTDRCVKAHEYIFLLTKSKKYYFDHKAIKEPAVTPAAARNKNREGYQAEFPKGERFSEGERVYGTEGLRNKRSVWSVSTKPYKGAHFATFPPDLIEPCILAGCPEGGVVLDPFGGSGTTAGVALAHGRQAILCELNAEYTQLISARVESIIDRIHSAFDLGIT